MSPLRSGLQALALFLVATSFAQGATVYKWTDDKGVVQYTDNAPEGRPFTRIDVGRSGSRASAETDGADAETATSEAGADGASEGTSAELTPAQQRLETMKAICATARRNLDTLEKFEGVTMDRDGDGTAETLDAEARETELARNRQLINENCL